MSELIEVPKICYCWYAEYFNRGGNQNNCFLFGRSTSSQRIEVWRSYLRKRCLQWWMNYFKISMIEVYLMIVIHSILNDCDFAFLEFFKTNWVSSWFFGTTISCAKLKTLSHPVEYLIIRTAVVARTTIYQRTIKLLQAWQI